jgi:alpha-1,3-glucosyltransferase
VTHRFKVLSHLSGNNITMPITASRAAVLISLSVLLLTLLIVPSRYSTDFDVHRNWLAITSSLPVCQWYFEERFSQWTLDYPPLFAYFQHLLSRFAPLFDRNMLRLEDATYASNETVLFQRLTVGIGIIIYGFILCVYIPLGKRAKGSLTHRELWHILYNVFQPVLFFVDLVHFQYNGFLMALFALSLFLMANQRIVASCVAFSCLLWSKHIFLYCAPAFFFYVLGMVPSRGVSLIFKAAVSVVLVSLVSLAPFFMVCESFSEQMTQMLSRMFPFGRGLLHAYWAPNVWSIYAFMDRLLLTLQPTTNQRVTSLTRGLVGETAPFSVLPDITPRVTMLLTVSFMLPCLLQLARRPTTSKFVHAVYTCFLTSYMLGWHVHEKAVLYVTLPLSLLVFRHDLKTDFSLDLQLLTMVGATSVFPLLFWAEACLIRCAYLASFGVMFGMTENVAKPVRWYCWGWIGLQILDLVYGLLPFASRFAFVPVLAYSMYCVPAFLLVWLRAVWVTIARY